MKKYLLMLVALVCAFSVSSCKKEDSSIDIVGNWTYTGTEFHFDGSKIQFESNSDAIIGLMPTMDYTIIYSPLTGAVSGLVDFNFEQDGTVSIMGLNANWQYENGNLAISGGMINLNGYISGGLLYLYNNTVKTVLGYQVIRNYQSSATPTDEWIGLDGAPHEIKELRVYSK